MMECTPEIGNCHSVHTLWVKQSVVGAGAPRIVLRAESLFDNTMSRSKSNTVSLGIRNQIREENIILVRV